MFVRWRSCPSTYTEADRGLDGSWLLVLVTRNLSGYHGTTRVVTFQTLPPLPRGSYSFRFLRSAFDLLPFVSGTVLLNLALPDTWDYKVPSTAPDFFPKLCNGEGTEIFTEKNSRRFPRGLN